MNLAKRTRRLKLNSMKCPPEIEYLGIEKELIIDKNCFAWWQQPLNYYLFLELGAKVLWLTSLINGIYNKFNFIRSTRCVAMELSICSVLIYISYNLANH